MRIRRIAVLIDGGFFIKRLPAIVGHDACRTAADVAEWARRLCKRQVQRLVGEPFSQRHSRWLDHVYRLFYYDAKPYDGIAHHPLLNLQIQFAKTDEAVFRETLFRELRKKRKFALRLGKVTREDGWRLRDATVTKKLLGTRGFTALLDAAVLHARGGPPPPPLSAADADRLEKVAQAWKDLHGDDVRLALRQKGVDMRIGLDMSTLTLKRQVDTIILVTGDSDFVPAAKVARREGVEIILDPLGQAVNDDLHEHVDGVASVLRPHTANQGHDDEETDETTE